PVRLAERSNWPFAHLEPDLKGQTDRVARYSPWVINPLKMIPAVLTSEAEPVSEVFFPDPYHRQGNHRIHSYEGHTSTENLFSGSFLSQLSGQREDEHSIWFSISSASYDPPAVKHFVTMHNGAFQ